VLKYLALSSVIIVGVAIGVATWVNRDLIRIKISSVYARVAPKPAAPTHSNGDRAAGFAGDAPWALSALPECLSQVSKSSGSARYVRGRIPSGAARIEPPARLTYGDCTIAITGNAAIVYRGADRFRIPPSVEFYRAAGLLAVVRESDGNVELRVYQPILP
ncbi:MAG: hypothetical protein WCD03_11090, partial [Candidatus Cybelea sp.]